MSFIGEGGCRIMIVVSRGCGRTKTSIIQRACDLPASGVGRTPISLVSLPIERLNQAEKCRKGLGLCCKTAK